MQLNLALQLKVVSILYAEAPAINLFSFESVVLYIFLALQSHICMHLYIFCYHTICICHWIKSYS